MLIEMTRGKKYNLVVLYLVWAYNRLGEFSETDDQLTRTYRPWALVVSWDVIPLGSQHRQ